MPRPTESPRQMSGADKRRDPRVETQQSVWVEGQEVRVEAEALNMSRTGMFVVTRDSLPPPLGRTLDIKFDDPLEGTIRVTMELVWREDESLSARLGLRVADPQGREAFERVVARYLAQDEKPGTDR